MLKTLSLAGYIVMLAGLLGLAAMREILSCFALGHRAASGRTGAWSVGASNLWSPQFSCGRQSNGGRLGDLGGLSLHPASDLLGYLRVRLGRGSGAFVVGNRGLRWTGGGQPRDAHALRGDLASSAVSGVSAVRRENVAHNSLCLLRLGFVKGRLIALQQPGHRAPVAIHASLGLGLPQVRDWIVAANTLTSHAWWTITFRTRLLRGGEVRRIRRCGFVHQAT